MTFKCNKKSSPYIHVLLNPEEITSHEQAFGSETERQSCFKPSLDPIYAKEQKMWKRVCVGGHWVEGIPIHTQFIFLIPKIKKIAIYIFNVHLLSLLAIDFYHSKV